MSFSKRRLIAGSLLLMVLGSYACWSLIHYLAGPPRTGPLPKAATGVLSDEEEYKVRIVLEGGHLVDWDKLGRVGGLSEDAFPLYARMLDDPKEKKYAVVRTLFVLASPDMKGDRSSFVDRAVSRLTDPDWQVRSHAVRLLAQIGSTQDAAPVVALLSDDEYLNGIASAKTLAAIGDRRTLAAMDVWITTSYARTHPTVVDQVKYDASYRQDIAKYRDELKARLDKAAPPPAK
ncbi:MAG: HEAT repeat domain-containing protein [Fimbriiglobus sp.]